MTKLLHCSLAFSLLVAGLVSCPNSRADDMFCDNGTSNRMRARCDAIGELYFSPVAGSTIACTQSVANWTFDLTKILGADPSAMNPLPGRLSTGGAYYDARDRSWNTSYLNDSITCVQGAAGAAAWPVHDPSPSPPSGTTTVHDPSPSALSANQGTPGPASSPWPTRPIPSPVPSITPTATANSASTFTYAASNSARTVLTGPPYGLNCYNDSTTDCYVKLGTGASTTNFKEKVFAGSHWLLDIPYTGVVTAICDAANGNARCSEW